MEERRGLPTKEKLVDLPKVGNTGLPGMGKDGPSMREGCLFCKREVVARPNDGQDPMHD